MYRADSQHDLFRYFQAMSKVSPVLRDKSIFETLVQQRAWTQSHFEHVAPAELHFPPELAQTAEMEELLARCILCRNRCLPPSVPDDSFALSRTEQSIQRPDCAERGIRGILNAILFNADEQRLDTSRLVEMGATAELRSFYETYASTLVAHLSLLLRLRHSFFIFFSSSAPSPFKAPPVSSPPSPFFSSESQVAAAGRYPFQGEWPMLVRLAAESARGRLPFLCTGVGRPL